MSVGTDRTALSLNSLELPRLEALIELMFLAAYADGRVLPEERQLLRQRVVEGGLGHLGQSTVDAVLEGIETTLAQDGREARFLSIRRRLGEPRLRVEALAMAAQILWADQTIDPHETTWMARAAEALEIPVSEAMALLSNPPK